MTDSKLEAAIAAGLKIADAYAFNTSYTGTVEHANQAFTAYRDRFHALEAENERLREALKPFAAMWAKFLTDDITDHRDSAFTYWLFYFSETAEDYIDSAAIHKQAAAVLAESEGR